MILSRPDGAVLAEVLVAVLLLATLALATAPAALRTGSLMARGQAVLAGSELAARRLALERPAPGLACRPAGSGRDSVPTATLDWRITVGDSLAEFLAVIHDPRARWPAETLATTWGCTP